MWIPKKCNISLAGEQGSCYEYMEPNSLETKSRVQYTRDPTDRAPTVATGSATGGSSGTGDSPLTKASSNLSCSAVVF